LIYHFLAKSTTNTTRLPHFISLEQFNAITKMFRINADLNEYKELIYKLRNIYLSSNQQISILAYLVIFDMDPSFYINNIDTLRKIEAANSQIYETYISFSESKNFGIEEFIVILKKMTCFFNYNLETNQSVQKFENQLFDLSSTFNLYNTYSTEEESWLMNQFDLIEQAFRSVSLGDQMIKEFIMTSVGIPLPRDHMANIFAIFLERIWRVYRIHPEFLEMPTHQQKELITKNSTLGLALLVLKAESCKTFADQLQEGFGELNDQKWRELYSPLIEQFKNVPAIRMRQVAEKNSVALTSNECQIFQMITHKGSYLVSEPWFFKICLLLILTLPQGSMSDGSVGNALHTKYLTILQRRLNWINWNKVNEEEDLVTNEDKDMEKIMEGIQNLKIFSSVTYQVMCDKKVE